MNLFPNIPLTKTEVDIIAEALTRPSVIKYFHFLANEIGRDIVQGRRSPGQSAEEYLCNVAGFQGQISVLETLLTMKRPESAEPNE